MPRFFRKYRRTFRRTRRYSRRFIRRTRPGTRRFFRKQRKWAKPEIKYVMVNPASVSAPARGVLPTRPIMPTAIAVGAGQNGRVGQDVKLRKIILNMQMSCADGQGANTNQADCLIRTVMWTPVVSFTDASTYMNSLSITAWQQPLDWNMVKVHRDVTWRVGYWGWIITGGAQNFNVKPVYPSHVQKKFVIPFPRNVKFPPGNNDFDVNKDVLYITVFNPNSVDAVFDYDSKLTYIDP